MSDDDAPDRLKALEARLAAKRPDEKHHMEEHYSQAQLAWRMVIELVAGLGIGFGIGYGLDALLGTTPWMMLLFTGFGFAAGVKTMIATSKEVVVAPDPEAALRQPGAGAPPPRGGKDED